MTSKQGALQVRTRAEVKAQILALTGQKSRAATAAADDDTGSTGSDVGKTGELWLYGVVGGWWRGFDAESVSTALRAMDDIDTLYVRIHSPGGYAGDGIAIGNLLRNHKANVVIVVDGLAASAASVIAIAGDEIVMCPGSQMMLHDASTVGWGNAAALRRAAEWIDNQSQNYAGIYQYRAGGTVEQWRQVMTANDGDGTWYTAQDAVTAGLADSVGTRTAVGSPPTAPEDDLDDDEIYARAAHDLELLDACVHPAVLAAWRGEHPKPPSASAVGSPPTKEERLVDFTDEQIASLRKQVGFPEDADAATITAAVTEALTEQADPAATVQVPTGHVVIPKAKLDDLEAGATAGIAAAKELHENKREAFLNANRGKYAPANRGAWAKEYDRDPAATAEHFKDAPVLIPTVEQGHAEDTDTDAPVSLADVQSDPVYQNWKVS